VATVSTFKADVESAFTDTPSQLLLSLIDLIDSSINDAVINVAPFLN